MRKILFLIGIILVMLSYISTDANAQQNYAPYGGSFSPAGDFRVLFVAVRFGQGWDDSIKINSSWHQDSAFPNDVYGKKTFFSCFDDFSDSTLMNNSELTNVSKWYYLMSGGKFRMIVDTVSVVFALNF